MLVTDASRAHLPLLDLAVEAVAGGVDSIYLRGAWATGGDAGIAPAPDLVSGLRTRIGFGVALQINGPVTEALSARTGIHLRERDPIPSDARRVLGSAALIGRSVHSPEEAAKSAGMDYLLAGHVYPSASKPGRESLGLARFAEIAAAAPCPVLAIGGITPERVSEVIRAGAHGAAVIGAIAEADDPRAAAIALRSALDRAVREQGYPEESAMSEVMDSANRTSTFEIVVNGKVVAVLPGDTVHDFLASKRMTDQMAIVERNGQIVPRGEYGETVLAEGDRLEVVHAVGGG
jgi:thiamine biosynthesis protein ThiS